MSLERTEKTLRALKRRRKQRHAKLRELTREDEDESRSTGVGAGWWDGERGDGMACPVCDQFVRGDVDVVEAHVDALDVSTGGRGWKRKQDARARRSSACISAFYHD